MVIGSDPSSGAEAAERERVEDAQAINAVAAGAGAVTPKVSAFVARQEALAVPASVQEG